MRRMTRWIGVGIALAGLLLTATIGQAQSQSQPDHSSQEPLFISTEVVVDPYDQPPAKSSEPRSATSVGDDIMDPNGVSPLKYVQPVNET
jgi:hypothetical protein